MLKRFLIAFLLFSLTLSDCSEGCLRCSPNGLCVYCDPLNNFYLANGSCQKFGDTNCKQFDVTGKCLSCEKYYYLNIDLNTCLKISTEIPKCEFYFSEKTCSACVTGYMVVDGNCSPVEKPIPNCKIQIGTSCATCASGYILSLDGTACTASPETSGCSSYQNVACMQCSTGYVKNPNYYLSQILSFTFNFQNQLLSTYLYNNKNRVLDSFNAQTCQLGAIPNCISHLTFDKCSVCSSGYFVSEDGMCVSFPSEAIPNCAVYTSNKDCVRCGPGFQLTKKGSCIPVKVINNCIQYETQTQTYGCVLCGPSYRLLGKQCIPRDNFVENCLVMGRYSDVCDGCAPNFVPTSDRLKCLPSISNCVQYYPSNKKSQSLSCYLCEPTFYPSPSAFSAKTPSVCMTGNVQGCQRYDRATGACSRCDDKMVLSSGQCVPQNMVVGCSSYAERINGRCEICRSSDFLMTYRSKCANVGLVLNCAIYNFANVCVRCIDGYMFVSGKCQAINPAENCLQKSANYCTKCLKDFINDFGVCRSPLDHIVINCNITNTNGVNTYGNSFCGTCKENSFPFIYTDNFVCVETSHITIHSTVTLSSNCLQYGADLTCMRCVDGMMVKNGACVTSCGELTLYKQTVKPAIRRGNNRIDILAVDQINFCGPKITNCAVAVPDLFQPFPNSPRYSCIKCDANTIPVIDVNSPSSTGVRAVTTIPAPISQNPALSCLSLTVASSADPVPSPKKLGAFTTANVVENCDYYGVIEPGIGCVKCRHAYAGPVTNVVNQCSVYKDNFTCLRCNQGFFLKQPYECAQVTSIANCVKYDPVATTSKCTQCANTHYVNNDGTACVLRVRSLSVLNGTPVVAADDVTCNTGFQKLPVVSQVGLYTCTALPSNCVTPTIVSDKITGCDTCNNIKSYKSNSACIVGTIAFCNEYSQVNVNTCTTCLNGYYLLNNACVAHNVLDNPNCLTFSNTQNGFCDKCNPVSFEFLQVNKCKAIVIISNCSEYDSTTTCKTCKDGYRLANLKTACNLIPASENCVQQVPADIVVDATIKIDDTDKFNEFVYTCNKCKVGFIKSSVSKSYTNKSNNSANVNVNICVNWLAYKFENCVIEDPTVETVLTTTCNVCAAGFYDVDFTDGYVCTERDYQTKVNTLTTTNCEVINYVTNAYVCVKCVYPYILESGACTKNCAGVNVFNIRDFTIGVNGATNIYTLVDAACAAAPSQTAPDVEIPTDCDKIAPLIDDGTNQPLYGCIACKDGYLPTYKYSYGSVEFDPTTTDRPSTPFDAFPIVHKCILASKFKALTAQSLVYASTIQNCRFYFWMETLNTDEIVGCGVCNTGYNGVIRKYIDANTLEHGYIAECLAMAVTGAGSCNVTSSYNKAAGLGWDYLSTLKSSPLSMMYSCFQCVTSTEIPITVADYDETNKLFTEILIYDYTAPSQSVPAAYRPTTSTTNSYQTFCGAPPTGIPANCGLMAVNPSSALPLTHLTSYWCTACAPGYSPTYDADQNKITACTAIPNCPSGGSMFNGCGGCVYEYDYVTNSVSSKCVASTNTTFIASCFAANSPGKCLICNKGYTMGIDGLCHNITFPKCSSSAKSNPLKEFFFSVSNEATPTRDYETRFGKISKFFFEQKTGCTSCGTDSILTQVNAGDANLQKNVCINQKHHTAIQLVDNCLNYAVGFNPVQCKICNQGFVLTDVGTCVNATASKYLENCALVKVDALHYCVTCKNTTQFLNVGGMCLSRTGLISNCKTYDDNASKIASQAKCSVCEDLYFPDMSGNICTLIDNKKFPNCAKLTIDLSNCDKCKDFFVISTLTDGKIYCYPTKYQVSYDDFCVEYDSDQFKNQRKLKCNTCLTGYFGVDVPDLTKNYCHKFTLNENPLCDTYNVQERRLDQNSAVLPINNVDLKCATCVNVTANYYNTLNSTCVPRSIIDVNCQDFVVNADECSVCKPGFVLDPLTKKICLQIPFIRNFNPQAKSYIQSCSVLSSCIDTVYYEGLSKKINSLLSCHSCSSAGQIPFLVGRGGWPFQGIDGLLGYQLAITGNQRYMDLVGDVSTRCVTPAAASLNISSTAFNFPANCGVGFLNANSLPDASNSAMLQNVNRSRIAAMCVACQPKFAAIRSNDTNGMKINDFIGQCVSISNCESSNWFNYCSQCAPNYVYAYITGQGVLYDQCVLLDTNPNCFAAEQLENPSKRVCRFCKTGYTLNIDGICEMIRPPRCFINNMRFREYYGVEDFASGLVLSKDGTGCQKCDSGFVGLYRLEPKALCTQSPYIASNLVVETSNFIYKCKNYHVMKNKKLACQTCYEGFILTTSGKCVDLTQQPNCIVAYNNANCHLCNQNKTSIIDHVCATKTVDNCAVYSTNWAASNQICLICQPGFSLYANLCLPNTVTDCDISDSQGTCTTCAQGLIGIRSNSTKDYCFKVDPLLNCATLDPFHLQRGKLSCMRCSSNTDFFVSDLPDTPNFCLSSSPLSNCLLYNIRGSVGASTFTCNQCLGNYYLDVNGNCVKRTYSDSNCAQFNMKNDTCVACNDGYYLRPSGKGCVAFPNGIPGCRLYSQVDKCLACYEDYYLYQKKCLPVPLLNLIQNCVYYSDIKTCSLCKGSFAVVDGKCLPSVALNCQEYLSQTACLSCPAGYGLKEENGLTNCVLISSDNCAINNSVWPFPCITCKTGFYMKDGGCLQSNTTIANCVIYATSSSCAQCESGTALSPDGLSCVRLSSISGTLDPNCNISEIKAQKQCVACKPQQYFKNGACVNCLTDATCYGCSPNQPDKCQICAPGYYMTTAGTCIQNGKALNTDISTAQSKYLDLH